jgi:hypothetical protein
VLCVAEEILAAPLTMMLGMLMAAILYLLGMQDGQKENQELRQTIQELRISNKLLADQKQTLHPPTLARSASSDNTNSDYLQGIKSGKMAGLVIDMRKYKSKNYPSLHGLLRKLGRRDTLATFIFDPNFSESHLTSRLRKELTGLHHQIGFSENRLKFADNETPVMTSKRKEENGGKDTDGLTFDFNRRIDAPRHSVSELLSVLIYTKPGDIVLVDPLNSNAVQALIKTLDYNSKTNGLRMVKVGELLRQRDRPST